MRPCGLGSPDPPKLRSRMSLPTELQAVRAEIADLKREAQEARQLSKDELYLTLREEVAALREKEVLLMKGARGRTCWCQQQLGPLRQEKERLAKGGSSPGHMHCLLAPSCTCMHASPSDLGDHMPRLQRLLGACMRNQRARHAAARRACSWPSAGAG
jgi:hypothetical protein